MGSIISKPKAPSSPVVYVPAPVPTTSADTQSNTNNTANTAPQPIAEDVAAENRKENLLARNRGRFGTVVTSFRGFLGERDSGLKRKTLLGE